VVLLEHESIVATQDAGFLPGQLRLCEAEACDSFRFREQCLQTTFDAVFLNKRIQKCNLFRPRQEATSSAEAKNKWRIRLLREFSKTRVQHSGKEPVHGLVSVSADCTVGARGHKRVDLDACRRGLFVGVDGDTDIRAIRDVECLSLLWRLRSR